MPLTPYHLGPAAATGLIFKRFIDIPTVLVAGVVLDFEPFVILLFNLNYDMHGFFHSFLLGTGAALVTAAVMYALKDQIKPVMAVFRLEQDSSFIVILFSSLIGVYSHVILDSFPYRDIRPFYPSDYNPFYRSVYLPGIKYFCLASFGAAIPVYLIRLIYLDKPKVKEEERAENS